MKIESIQWKSSQPLTEDYIRRYDLVEALFEYNPQDVTSWERRAGWLDRERRLQADRGRLAEALRQFNTEIGGAPQALQAVDLLGDERTLCIVGGQQAGLFTGQALVIYKAVTLIRTAQIASARLGRPVVPVFWIAGEDHDFDEVNHMYYMSQDAQVNKIKLDHPSGVRSSVSRLAISPEQWEEALEQLDASLMPTEFKADWMGSLRAIAEESRSLVDFFARMMARLFGSRGLVLMNADDPRLRSLESAMFHRLIEEHGPLQAAVLKGKDKVESLGYASQVEMQQRNANLFVIDGGERILLYADEASDGFTDRKRERSYSRQQLLDWADSAPERLSNNVMTRPLMQDYLFPVLGTVLGPGEIAYWALTREAFHRLGMQMPIVIPRMEFTLLEGTVQKNMAKYHLSLDDVLCRLEEKQQEWLREQDALNLEDRFGQVKTQFKDMYQPLVQLIAGVNPGLGKLGDTNMTKIIEQIEFLEHKASDAVRTQFDASLRQFQRIGASVLPLGKPQERVYNVLAYLNKYGTVWLEELLDSELEPDGRHNIVYL
ncbi:bacillithiol biosynthesis cysteine-adding enzyme BshC [Paenibacillus piri]|uniref:Putative cysteine ligase BshC n=1 Tax=Paenibacillus piri TaxID=2547395 RepID=A0A4R5KNI4_9BACL|nr:bacillithiol biosynthesis cysteine-adding enzyme BshC [Paenibacillus piri]TDF96812.1 bacillithiol biosynthesis cysteine-adding enzyme BshC [Paenibacillus piri]